MIYYLTTSTKEHYSLTDGCDCLNCGLCRTENGNIDCVHGDLYGPFFRRDCMNYTHSSRVNNFSQFDNRYISFWNNNRYNRRPIYRNHHNMKRNRNNWHINNQSRQLHNSNQQNVVSLNNNRRR